MAHYKLQIQENAQTPDIWTDVPNEDGTPLLFTNDAEARAALIARFPVLVKMEQLGVDRKRTRVVIVNPYQDIDDEKEDGWNTAA